MSQSREEGNPYDRNAGDGEPYKTARTFAATMNANTTSSGTMGTRSVLEIFSEVQFHVSSACALTSSRMIKKRIRDTTAAAPKAATRRSDVIVVMVVSVPIPSQSRTYLPNT